MTKYKITKHIYNPIHKILEHSIQYEYTITAEIDANTPEEAIKIFNGEIKQ